MEIPFAFTVAPCNMNDKRYFKPLLDVVRFLGVKFGVVLADAQNSARDSRVRDTSRGA